MKKNNVKHLSLRIEPELLYKLRYVAAYSGRSANGQLLYLVRKSVEDFEKQYGVIKVNEVDK